MSKELIEIPYYQVFIKKLIGDGGYGAVYEAIDLLNNSPIAFKRNYDGIGTNFCGSIRELDLMNYLRHPFLINLKGVCYDYPKLCIDEIIPENTRKDPISFISELASYDGYTIIKDCNATSGLFHRIIMMNVLLGLEYMHAKGVIHRDIKPGNLLWYRYDDDNLYFKSRAMKLCDLGLSEFYTKQNDQCSRVITPFYRPPEILLNNSDYGYEIDIWSLGATFFELFSGRILYKIDNPMLNEMELNRQILTKIVDITPFFDGEDMKEIDKLGILKSFYYINKTNEERKKILKDLMGISQFRIDEFELLGSFDNYLDLLSSMLTINSKKRITATEALNHPTFDIFRSYIDRIRKLYPPIPTEVEKVKILKCVEREWAFSQIKSIYNNRDKIVWYSHRIIFHAIDLFDRYLLTLDKKYTTFNISNNVKNGYYLTENESSFNMLICLYLSVKYFMIIYNIWSFKEMFSIHNFSDEDLAKANFFEINLIKNVLNYKIYHPTLYEIASENYGKKLTSLEIKKLFDYYENIEVLEEKPITLILEESGIVDRKKINLPVIPKNSKENVIYSPKNKEKDIYDVYISGNGIINNNNKVWANQSGNIGLITRMN